MAERADDDVALGDLGHAAAGQLERVVRRLVVEDLDDQHDAFLARNVVVATRSSWPRFSAWVMEAILSTQTVL